MKAGERYMGCYFGSINITPYSIIEIISISTKITCMCLAQLNSDTLWQLGEIDEINLSAFSQNPNSFGFKLLPNQSSPEEI